MRISNPKRLGIEDAGGINYDYVRKSHTGSAKPEDWEIEYDPKLKKIIDSANDAKYNAAKMHQPFENFELRLNQSLGLFSESRV